MNNSKRHPLSWIPSLYFVEGLPYIIVTVVSLIMYKRFGLSDTESAAYSAWLSLPWVIKPLWSPIVEMFKTKRWWILTMQALMSMALSLIAFSIPTSYYVQASLALFFLIAFSSATHDISADGFYMTALDEHDQAQYVGIRSTFYRLATIFTEGLLLMYIGNWEVITRNVPLAWSIGLGTIAILLFLTAGYHLWALPKVEHNAHENEHRLTLEEATKEFGTTFLTFFQKPMIGSAIIFMLFYRLPEALLTKIFPLFLTAKAEHGGLALTTQQFGFAYGTVGVIGLTLGGILGGMAVARHGFQRWKWPMVIAISLPNFFYCLLAYYQPTNFLWANLAIAVEQFGYGFGFTLYMLFLLYFAQGKSKASHYALCTGFMALSMTIPGFTAGWIADQLGYYTSFILVMCLIPVTFWVTSIIKVPNDYGRKTKA
jgi:beta-lactamase induction signal transducer